MSSELTTDIRNGSANGKMCGGGIVSESEGVGYIKCMSATENINERLNRILDELLETEHIGAELVGGRKKSEI